MRINFLAVVPGAYQVIFNVHYASYLAEYWERKFKVKRVENIFACSLVPIYIESVFVQMKSCILING